MDLQQKKETKQNQRLQNVMCVSTLAFFPHSFGMYAVQSAYMDATTTMAILCGLHILIDRRTYFH